MSIAPVDSSKLYMRDVALKLGSGVVAFLMHFAAGIIVARVLGAEGNGLVALLILIPTMIVTLGNLGIDKANGYLVGAKKYSPETLLGNAMFLTLTLTLLIGLVYWLALPLILDFLATDKVNYFMVGFVFLLIPLTLFEFYLQGILWGLNRIVHLSVVSIIRFGSLLFLNLILVWWLTWGVLGAIVAAVATPVLCVALYLFFLRHDVSRVRLSYHMPALKESFVFGVQAHLGNVFHFLNWRLDTFIVNYFVGIINVGFYVVAATLAELLWYLPDAFGFVLFPKTAASDPEAAAEFTPKVARLTGFLTAGGAIALFLISRLLITLLYTEEFLPALYPLWILLPGVVALSYSKVIFSDLGGRGKPYYGTYASLISLGVTIGFDLLLIPLWGIAGAATATTLSYLTNTGAALFFYRRVTGNKISEVLFIQKCDLENTVNTGRDVVLAISQTLRA